MLEIILPMCGKNPQNCTKILQIYGTHVNYIFISYIGVYSPVNREIKGGNRRRNYEKQFFSEYCSKGNSYKKQNFCIRECWPRTGILIEMGVKTGFSK